MYTNNKKVIKTFAEFLKANFNHIDISNCREVKPNYYALSKLYMYKDDRLCDLVELGGADAIVFTAGVGENSISTRKQIVEKLDCLGIKLDEERNNVRGKEALISSDDSKVLVYVIPTNEELMIATDTYNLAK